jgi:hypothetical protein
MPLCTVQVVLTCMSEAAGEDVKRKEIAKERQIDAPLQDQSNKGGSAKIQSVSAKRDER